MVLIKSKIIGKMGDKAKQKEWLKGHKMLRISNDAHRALLRYAGALQAESGVDTTVSDAIIILVDYVMNREKELKDVKEVKI